MQFIPLNLNASWQDKIGIPQRKRLRHDTNRIFSLPAADFPPPVFPFSRGAGDKERGIKGAAGRRNRAGRIRGLFLRARLGQDSDDVFMTFFSSKHQRCAAVRIFRVDVRARTNQ